MTNPSPFRNYSVEILDYLKRSGTRSHNIRPLLREFAKIEGVPIRFLRIILNELTTSGAIVITNDCYDLLDKNRPVLAKLAVHHLEISHPFQFFAAQ